MYLVAGVFRGDGIAVGPPLGVIFRRGIQPRVDGHGPVQATYRAAQLQVHHEFQRTVHHAHFRRARHRRMPLMPGHADIERQRPVRLAGDAAGIGEERAFALVQQHEVALDLAPNIFERVHFHRGSVAEGEGVLDAQRQVVPGPAIAVLRQLELVRVVTRQRFHDQLQHVPLRIHHVRQRGVAARILGQRDRLVMAFGDVVLVDIQRKLEHRTGLRADMRLDVDRVHVLVFREREGEATDRLRRVAIGVVVAESLFLECQAHDDSFRCSATYACSAHAKRRA